MDKNNDGSNMMRRRRALQVIGVGLGTAGGLLGLSGCNKSGGQGPGQGDPGAKAPGPAGSCQDKIAVDDNARNLRKILQYKEKGDTPEKKCSACAQYEAGKYAECGGCKLFAGAVSPEGVCLSFAPLQAPPAATGVSPSPAGPAAPAVPAKGT